MQQTRNSAVLRASLGLSAGATTAAVRQILARAGDSRLYPTLLATVYQSACSTVPLMEAAILRCRERADQDAVCTGLLPYFVAHSTEEQHHDEWLLEDLEVAGAPRADVLGRVPSPDMAAMVGAQYYWIHHHHPVALLGHFLALEGNPVGEGLIGAMQAGSGLPDAAFRTYRIHARLDPEHSADLFSVLDRLPLTRAHLLLIGQSMLHTLAALTRVLGAVVREVDERRAQSITATPRASSA